MITDVEIIAIFNREFADLKTVLIGGKDEPLYLPDKGEGAILYFRADYVASALHEISHWCIAGTKRLQLEDFGYWYIPDGRSQEEQNAFYSHEVKPQALEWIFCDALHLPFNISADNLLGDGQGALEKFKNNVAEQKAHYLASGMPPRAKRFLQALALKL